MPLAQWVTLRGRATRKTYDADATGRGQLQQRQSYYNNNSEANVECLRMHEITVAKDQKECSKAKTSTDDPSGLFFTVKGKAADQCHVMTSYKNEKCTVNDHPWNTTPFWAVSAPVSVISNHSEIFKSRIPAFLQAIIEKYTIDVPKHSNEK